VNRSHWCRCRETGTLRDIEDSANPKGRSQRTGHIVFGGRTHHLEVSLPDGICGKGAHAFSIWHERSSLRSSWHSHSWLCSSLARGSQSHPAPTFAAHALVCHPACPDAGRERVRRFLADDEGSAFAVVAAAFQAGAFFVCGIATLGRASRLNRRSSLEGAPQNVTQISSTKSPHTFSPLLVHPRC